MTEKLYIIGNGFDLWHGLPTGYRHFYSFAKDNLDEISEYYSLDISETEPWHDFENALGLFNWNEFYDNHNNIDVAADDFRPSFAYGLEDDLTELADKHVEDIKESFQEWVSNITKGKD